MADKPSTQILQAPSAGTGEKMTASGVSPGAGGKRYAPDDRLARPDVGRFGEEVVNGDRRMCMGAMAEHADPQSRLNILVGVCLAKGYVTSVELLTRRDEESDFATDVCVRRVGVDPETGSRYVEEVSFEVANTQTLKNLEEIRVPKLLASGIRRVFVVLVQEGDVLEWSTLKEEWIGWAPGEEILDPVFVQPLAVTAILDAAAVDQLVSKAQLTKEEPYLMEEIKKRELKAQARGEARGLAKSILRAFKKHGITLNAENREAILECHDMAILERWFDKALGARSAAEVLAELEKVN
jgi:hypothetical protein